MGSTGAGWQGQYTIIDSEIYPPPCGVACEMQMSAGQETRRRTNKFNHSTIATLSVAATW